MYLREASARPKELFKVEDLDKVRLYGKNGLVFKIVHNVFSGEYGQCGVMQNKPY